MIGWTQFSIGYEYSCKKLGKLESHKTTKHSTRTVELRKFVDLGKLYIPGNPFGTGFLVALLICEVFAESQRESAIFNFKKSKQTIA